MKYLILILAWSIYLALHSWLASQRVKNAVQQSAPFLYRRYRFLYSLFSTAGLFALLVLMAASQPIYLLAKSTSLQYIGMVLASWGVILVILSFRQLSGSAFLGLKPQVPSRLITTGIHGYVRHPIYSGTILVLVGMWFYIPTDSVLISIVVIFAYLPVGIYLEEQKLIAEYGEAYREYQRKVKALVPWVF